MTDYENILLRDYSSKSALLTTLQDDIMKLPKGTLRKKLINNKEYHYLQYRNKGLVKSIYVPNTKIEQYQRELSERCDKSLKIKELKLELKRLEKALGAIIYSHPDFHNYKAVKNVDYQKYTLFMSSMAHELKRLGKNDFIMEHSPTLYRGLEKRYVRALISYLKGELGSQRNSSYLVLDPFTYQLYFKYNDKSSLNESLKNAIPQFLRQGILLTDIQEAVGGTLSQ